MAADLHLHVRTPECTDAVMRSFFGNTIGSSWGPTSLTDVLSAPASEHDRWMDACDTISKTPQVWIGEVSWLKAALFDDGETFVPDPISEIAELVGDDCTAELTDEMIDRIIDALTRPNSTSYSIASIDDVRPWLEEHRGKPIFCVSW